MLCRVVQLAGLLARADRRFMLPTNLASGRKKVKRIWQIILMGVLAITASQVHAEPFSPLFGDDNITSAFKD
jgi:hypothetical protein